MLCDECKQNPAVMHYVSIVNGQKTEYDLCESCASKLGMKSFSPFTWGDLFPHAVKNQPQQIRCSQCGTTLSEFKRNALVGCTHCYSDLRVGIEPVLRQVQKGLTHIGRAPAGYEKQLPSPGETTPEAPLLSHEDELQIKMHEAIASEDFESAAMIRDELKSLRHEAATQNAAPASAPSEEG